eukprot:PhF_6_TR26173/c0_g2_i2/m.37177
MIQNSSEVTYAELKNYNRMFRTFDYDNNDSIDPDELYAICKALGYKLSQAEVTDYIRALHSGDEHYKSKEDGLNYQEFLFVMMEIRRSTPGLDVALAARKLEESLKSKHYLPEDIWRWVFDAVLYIVTAYYCIRVPLSDVRSVDVQYEWEWLATLIFMTDFLLNFVTVQTDGYGEDVDEGPKIAVLYMRRWGVVDFLSSVPMDLVSYHAGNYLGYLVLLHFRLLKAFRLPSLFRTSRRGSHRPSLLLFQIRIVPVILMLFYLSLVIHLYTVVWLSLSPSASYVEGIYLVLYTITTVGLGDIKVETTAQQIFNCFLFVSGAVVNGFVISKLSQILQKASVQEEKDEKLSSMVSLLQYFQIPVGIQEEILAFQHHQLESDLSSAFKDCIDSLPPVLQDQLSIYARLEHVSRLPMFRTAHIECRMAIARSLSQKVFSPLELIICAGEKGHEMYFLTHGYANVITSEGEFVVTLSKGCYFGEYALQNSSCQTASVMALSYCDTLCLGRDSFMEISQRYPGFHEEAALNHSTLSVHYESLPPMLLAPRSSTPKSSLPTAPSVHTDTVDAFPSVNSSDLHPMGSINSVDLRPIVTVTDPNNETTQFSSIPSAPVPVQELAVPNTLIQLTDDRSRSPIVQEDSGTAPLFVPPSLTMEPSAPQSTSPNHNSSNPLLHSEKRLGLLKADAFRQSAKLGHSAISLGEGSLNIMNQSVVLGPIPDNKPNHSLFTGGNKGNKMWNLKKRMIGQHPGGMFASSGGGGGGGGGYSSMDASSVIPVVQKIAKDVERNAMRTNEELTAIRALLHDYLEK